MRNKNQQPAIVKSTAHNYIIIIPVYNDWTSLSITIKDIERIFREKQLGAAFLLIVNDGSTLAYNDELFAGRKNTVEILHLHRNIGHQKAIAVGLAYINDHYLLDKVIIMDADGEDNPDNIPKLLGSLSQSPDKIILAKRTRRTEGIKFRLLYRFYKLFFYILTGKKIAFGNFCVMSAQQVLKIVHYSEIWNNVAGGIIKSGMGYTSIPLPKSKRHEGKSKMNFTSLVVHGLNTISVFIETIAVRILILSAMIILVSALSIAIIAFIRIFTPFAISGWASILASSMLVILLQSFLISLIMIVIFLSSQSQRKIIPAYHYTDYLNRSEIL